MERGYRREDEVEREKREKKTGRDERMRSGGKIEGKKAVWRCILRSSRLGI
jgi:hypothetical protein